MPLSSVLCSMERMLGWLTGQMDLMVKGHVWCAVMFCFQVRSSHLYAFLLVINPRALHTEQAHPRERDLVITFKEMKGISGACSACSQHTFPEQGVDTILKPFQIGLRNRFCSCLNL